MFQTCRKGRRNVLIEAVEQRRERVGALTSEGDGNGNGNGRVRIEEAGDYLVHLSLLHDHHQMATVAEQARSARAGEASTVSAGARGGTMASWMPLTHSAWGGGNITSVNQSAQNASGGQNGSTPDHG
ncbi:hypothetical protein C0075_05745 [Rhizobium sp. KAs_5_22]|uniref:hypothetical protein n=1 Tax=Ciceribacter selenitireducens TaxID=448181 RepID=UPI00048A78DB|nr:hypothetical protein [Ciceribacter selenitireducens]PPJ45266.1 hypothetical protein C0075_05745 [Rhizobium sp. KAs_5_22]